LCATNFPRQTTANSADCGQFAYAQITNNSALNLNVNKQEPPPKKELSRTQYNQNGS